MKYFHLEDLRSLKEYDIWKRQRRRKLYGYVIPLGQYESVIIAKIFNVTPCCRNAGKNFVQNVFSKKDFTHEFAKTYKCDFRIVTICKDTIWAYCPSNVRSTYQDPPACCCKTVSWIKYVSVILYFCVVCIHIYRSRSNKFVVIWLQLMTYFSIFYFRHLSYDSITFPFV